MTFQEEYKRLNKAQKEAVDTIEGPVMVVAGPGTGKTQVLTLRIANILDKTDTAPEQILALTFTEAAATNMRRRLRDLIGALAYRVHISTFHSWCQEVIDRYSESFPEITGGRPLGEADKIMILERIMDDLNLPLLRKNGSVNAYTRDVAKAISDIKREGLLPEEFHNLIERSQDVDRKRVDKNKDLAQIYTEYEKQLHEHRKYDFDDMIVEVLKVIRTDDELRAKLQEQYQYVLIDEHQDTNNAQNAVIETLMNFYEEPNLFVVGDEKQAIFRFQGATLENFYYFRDKYKNAKLITLSQNYRSHAKLLEAAGGLLGKGTLEAQSATDEKESISLLHLPTAELERFAIASKLKKLIDTGVRPEEIAVIYRDNKYASRLSLMLKNFSIPHRIEGKEDLFREPDIRALISFLRALYEFGLDVPLTEVLFLPLSGISPIDAARITRFARDSWRKGFGIYDILTDSKLLNQARVKNLDSVEKFVTLLNQMHRLAQESDLCTLVESLLKESGILSQATNSKDSVSRFASIRAFLKITEEICESTDYATLADLFARIEIMERYGLSHRHKRSRKEGFVRLMTAHGAKGLEFEHVVIVHAMDGIWGGRRTVDKVPLLPEVFISYSTEREEDAEADERRLFYVALTRARKSVTISESDRDDSDRERAPAQFVSEIDPSLLTLIKTDTVESEYEAAFPTFFEKGRDTIELLGEAMDKSFVQELFQEEGLSATALNNYLECPWRYFYRNLLCLPEVREPHLYYGQAMHKAIERYVLKRKEEETIADTFLTTVFRETLFQMPLPKRETEIYTARGVEALGGWIRENKDRISSDAIPEFKIRKLELAPGILISGTLDRVDGTLGGSVHIVDYKTGKPRSRNEIVGMTKSANKDYYRQLVFYKLLLSLYKGGVHEVETCEINFLEPTEAGNYKREEFKIEDREVKELVEIIKAVSEEIRNFSFTDKGCNKEDCTYCALAKNL